MQLVPEAPAPRGVLTRDGQWLAVSEFGAPDAPAVLAVHGFASSAIGNWHATGWTRELTRAGLRVVAVDQRGHGHSTKPHDPAAYSMEQLVDDVLLVMDVMGLEDVDYVGYSLGARVGWHAALQAPDRIRRAVFGGIPDGDPLTRFRIDQAKALLAVGLAVEDRLTQAYLTMAASVPGNDPAALVALVEGMRGGPQPDRAHPPAQPILFAAGSDDRIIDSSRSLAASAPAGQFFEIPGRNHFNAPTSRAFRDAARDFLAVAGPAGAVG